jgi:hypothetical protein
MNTSLAKEKYKKTMNISFALEIKKINYEHFFCDGKK